MEFKKTNTLAFLEKKICGTELSPSECHLNCKALQKVSTSQIIQIFCGLVRVTPIELNVQILNLALQLKFYNYYCFLLVACLLICLLIGYKTKVKEGKTETLPGESNPTFEPVPLYILS